VVLLVLGHGRLQVEHVHEGARLLVGKDAAHRMRVADVHVPVEEPRRDDHGASVDHAIGARVRELRRLAHASDAPVLHEHGGVLDDAALPIEGEEIEDVIDLETLLCHEGPPPGNAE
jgi:hypothetical protein